MTCIEDYHPLKGKISENLFLSDAYVKQRTHPSISGLYDHRFKVCIDPSVIQDDDIYIMYRRLSPLYSYDFGPSLLTGCLCHTKNTPM